MMTLTKPQIIFLRHLWSLEIKFTKAHHKQEGMCPLQFPVITHHSVRIFCACPCENAATLQLDPPLTRPMLPCKENGAKLYTAGPPDGSCRAERPRSADLLLWWPRGSTSVRRRTVLAMCCDAVLRRAATIQNDDAEHDWLAQDKGGGQPGRRSWRWAAPGLAVCEACPCVSRVMFSITKLYKMGVICLQVDTFVSRAIFPQQVLITAWPNRNLDH